MRNTISEYVTLLSYVAGDEDAHGNATESWEPPVEVGIYAFDPGSTSEPRDGGSRVIVEPTVYMPSSTIFQPQDRVTVRGVTHEVDGVTREWSHPNGGHKGNVATLRAVNG